MKVQQKKRAVQKLWGWACLSINCLIIALFLGEKVADYLTRGGLLSLVILCYGVIKTCSDMSKDNLSGTSVLVEYVCVYILTFLSAVKVVTYLSSIALLLWLVVVSLVELFVFLLITYWHTIRNFFRKTRRTRRTGDSRTGGGSLS